MPQNEKQPEKIKLSPQGEGPQMEIEFPHYTWMQEFMALFLAPGYALFRVQILFRWKTAFFSLLVMLACFSFVHGCSTAKDVYRENLPAVQGVAEAIAPVVFQNNRLGWKNMEKPLHFEGRQWTLDFAGKESSGKFDDVPSLCHFIVTPERIVCRVKLLDGDKSLEREVLTPRQIAASSRKNGTVLEYANLMRMNKIACCVSVPFLMLGYFLHFSQSLVLFLLIFIVATLVFRRGAYQSWKQVVAVALNFSVPPTLLALAWDAALVNVSYDTIFACSFIFYLFFVFFLSRIQNRTDNE